MSRKLYGFLITIFIMLPQLFMATQSVAASARLSVGLTRFVAIPLDNAALLEWDTETELGTAGFMLKRGQDGSFAYISDPEGTANLFISSEGGPIEGFEYAFTDETAVNGESYTYQLIEVQIDASELIIADTTVTIGVVPTNTPIILGAVDGNATSTDFNAATGTATATATAVPAAGTPTNSAPVSPATPVPPIAKESAAPSIPVVDEAAPVLNTDTQSTSSQPLVEENQAASQTWDEDTAVAFAQEEPTGYPGSEAVGEEPEDSLEGIQAYSNNELDVPGETGANAATLESFGTNPYPAANPPTDFQLDQQNSGYQVPPGGLEGKIYLWVAFIAAIVIFTAAVLGTILIYTRQRSQE